MKKEIIDLLEKQGKDLKGLHPETIKDWKNNKHQMKVEKVEKALKANDLPEPFFWDGKMESFIEFSITCAAKLGKKLTIKFE